MTAAIVHIGDGKCGTTAVQASLFDARQDLLERGILYHAPARGHGHFSYCTLLGDATRGNDERQRAIARRNLDETRDPAIAPRRFPAAVRGIAVLSRARQDRRTAHRHRMRFQRNPDYRLYPPAGRMYLSLMQQRLKASHRIVRPDRYRHDIHTPAARWAAHPACRRLLLRLFDKGRMRNGSVVNDFQDALEELTGKTGLSMPDMVANQSLSAEQIIVLQRYRRDFLAAQDNSHHSASDSLLNFLGASGIDWNGKLTPPRLCDPARVWIDANSAGYLRALDAMFPSLGIPEWGRSGAPQAGEALQPWTSEDVATILREYSDAAVQHLQALVLADGSAPPAAMEYFAFTPDDCAAYSRYLEHAPG